MAAVVDAVRNTVTENFGGTHSLARKEHQFSLSEVPDQTGKVAVITGGSRGIGYACVHTLLEHNISKVFFLSRGVEYVDEARKQITSEISAEASDKVRWLNCDLSDWSDVAKAAEEIQDDSDRVDILINNAGRGIMTYQLTDYGVDQHMAINHIAHVVLTSKLLPLMKKTADGGDVVRIVNMGSNAHQGAPSDCKFASLEELNQDLGPNGQYGRSKLATMLYAKYLTKHLNSRNPKILANSVHPGFVSTEMSKKDIHEPYPIAGYAMSVGMEPFKKDQWEGAVSALYCGTKTERSGEYVCPPAVPEEGSKLYQDQDGSLSESLMNLTRTILKEKASQDDIKNVEFY